MRRRNPHRSNNPPSMTFEPASFSWSYLLITILGAVAVAAGLFFAATRHFSAMELGITNAKLRAQLQELNNEKRRLELEKEIALTPAELRRNARAAGLREVPLLIRDADSEKSESIDAATVAAANKPEEQIQLATKVSDVSDTAKAFRKPDADRSTETTRETIAKRETKVEKQKQRSDRLVETSLEVRPRIVANKASQDRKEYPQLAKTSSTKGADRQRIITRN